MHPTLVAALAEDHQRPCSYGAATQQPCRLYRGFCRQRLEMQDHAATPSRHSPLARPFGNVRPFARVLSLLQSINKGCQS
jgi:hypothetical protein